MLGRVAVAALILAALLAGPVRAADFQAGLDAYERGDYATALKEWRPLAYRGHPGAQSSLGVMYDYGQGVAQDYAEAVKWYRHAAEQGHPGGQILLGEMYRTGRGVAQDYAEAVKWYRRAAEQGIATGQFYLGLFYTTGEGVAQDYAEAVKWYRHAAEQGHAKAQSGLGVMYELGRGVAQDYVQAHLWFNLAASRLPPGETRNYTVQFRDEVEKRMTPAQVAEAQRLARNWRPRKLTTEEVFGVPGKDAEVSKPPTEDTAPVRQRIARIQHGLASLGYDPGPADGVLGPRTRAAIRAFEAREGLPVTGMISERLEAALRSASPAVASTTPPAPGPLKKVATGSGFIVSPHGHILTNEHVIAACREVRVAGTGNAVQMATDENIDLALLKIGSDGHNAVPFRGGRGVRTGEDIVVVGYPLQGLLTTEMNATKGTVSALAGPGNDQRIIQITAPVQPGNSGGPVLDTSGNVVGVVVGKLDAIKFANVTGTLPENVNFAISEGAARAFLDGHDVPYETAPSTKPVPTADIAANAKGYTVLIECWK